MSKLEDKINRHDRKTIIYNQDYKVKGGVMCGSELKEVDTKNITCPICGHKMELCEMGLTTDRGRDFCESYHHYKEDLGSIFGMDHSSYNVRSHLYHQNEYPAKLRCHNCQSELNVTLSSITLVGDVLDTYTKE